MCGNVQSWIHTDDPFFYQGSNLGNYTHSGSLVDSFSYLKSPFAYIYSQNAECLWESPVARRDKKGGAIENVRIEVILRVPAIILNV